MFNQGSFTLCDVYTIYVLQTRSSSSEAGLSALMVHTVEQFFTLIGHKGKDVWSSGKPNNQQKLLQHCFFCGANQLKIHTHVHIGTSNTHAAGQPITKELEPVIFLHWVSQHARCTQRVPLVTFSQRPIYRRSRRRLIAFSPHHSPHNVKLRAAMLLYDYFFFFFPQKKAFPVTHLFSLIFFLFFGKMCSWWCAQFHPYFPLLLDVNGKPSFLQIEWEKKDVVTHAPTSVGGSTVLFIQPHKDEIVRTVHTSCRASI